MKSEMTKINERFLIEFNAPFKNKRRSVNGFGAVFGSISSGYLIEMYFLNDDGSFQWKPIWLSFAAYAAVIAILFALLFKHKHDRNLEVRH